MAKKNKLWFSGEDAQLAARFTKCLTKALYNRRASYLRAKAEQAASEISIEECSEEVDKMYPQIFKKEVFCISSKGFNQRDAYRVMLRKYPDVMNIEQMCDALRISTKTGYKLLHEGKIPAMKIGRSYRIPKAHLFTYLQICGQHCRAENRQC